MQHVTRMERDLSVPWCVSYGWHEFDPGLEGFLNSVIWVVIFELDIQYKTKFGGETE